MIFGRPANLAMGAITALLNVAALSHVGGFAPNVDLLAAINVAAGALISFFGYQANAALTKATNDTVTAP